MLQKYNKHIPTGDSEAWLYFPDHRHIYNKLWVAESQGIPCGPMGIYPEHYPVIFKPIINLYGMSRGVKKINNDIEYDENIHDGFFWEEFFNGDHRCIDLIIKNGKIIYMTCLISIERYHGLFDYHMTDLNYKLSDNIRRWVNTFFDEYTGCVNIETINDNIIECHLRLNGDSQLYDKIFVKEMYDVLFNNESNINYKIKETYLIPIFVNKNCDLNINKDKIMSMCDQYGANTVNFNDIDSNAQSDLMSRLLMFDIFDLAKGFLLRKRIICELYI
jgi:hypothetical protein